MPYPQKQVPKEPAGLTRCSEVEADGKKKRQARCNLYYVVVVSTVLRLIKTKVIWRESRSDCDRVVAISRHYVL